MCLWLVPGLHPIRDKYRLGKGDRDLSSALPRLDSLPSGAILLDKTEGLMIIRSNTTSHIREAFLSCHQFFGHPPSGAWTHCLPLTLAEGKYPGTNNNREGLVIRPRQEAIRPTLNGRLSFKVMSNRFLLRAGE